MGDRVNYAKRIAVTASLAAAALVLLAGCAQARSGVAPEAAEGSADAVTGASCPLLPEGFEYVSDVDPSIAVELRYATRANFTGEVVDGYESESAAVLRDDAAEALAAVQSSLAGQGLELLVFDAYRPTRAVQFFMDWAQTDDDATQAEYYPTFEKPQLFELGYIAERSKHSLGGTVDLTLVDSASGEPLDMGGEFDLFDLRSHYEAEGIDAAQFENRTRLREAMLAAGFEPYPQEWWHFSFPLPESAGARNFAIGPC